MCQTHRLRMCQTGRDRWDRENLGTHDQGLRDELGEPAAKLQNTPIPGLSGSDIIKVKQGRQSMDNLPAPR